MGALSDIWSSAKVKLACAALGFVAVPSTSGQQPVPGGIAPPFGENTRGFEGLPEPQRIFDSFAMQAALQEFSLTEPLIPPAATQDAPGSPDYWPDRYARPGELPDYYYRSDYYRPDYGRSGYYRPGYDDSDYDDPGYDDSGDPQASSGYPVRDDRQPDARAMGDYGLPGYQYRDFQDAPGVPEYVPLVPPTPVSEEERERYVVRGMYPGSFLAPGTNTSVRLRGFVRLGGMYDFNPIGSRDDFVTNSIPVPQTKGKNFNYSTRYSRFIMETWTPTSFREWNVHSLIEGDFFNGPAHAAGAGGNPFRLRFAFVDFGYFRIGQQNTVFMDSNAWPSTADFAGPRGLVNLRRPSIRVTLPVRERMHWAIGIEQPFSDITTHGLGLGVQDAPDLASHLRYDNDLGHVQFSGLARSIGWRDGSGETTRHAGWGVSGSTAFHPWAAMMGTSPLYNREPSGLQRSRILLQYTYGHGIARYLQDSAGQGLDGQVDPLTGEFDDLRAAGWTASYEHWFNAHWLSNWTYSEVAVDSFTGQDADTYNHGRYLAASLWWLPVNNVSVAVEYLYGERENLDSQRGEAHRIQTLAQYNF